MSGDPLDVSTRIAAAREAFDMAFALPEVPPAPAREGALEIGVGPDRYVLRLSQLDGVFVDRPVTTLPGAAKGFLGVVALGTAVLPAWDLRVLLGYAPGSRPRWLASLARRTVALAFDSCSGHLHPDTGAFGLAAPGASSIVRETVAWKGSLLPVLDVESILRVIGSLVAPGSARKER